MAIARTTATRRTRSTATTTTKTSPIRNHDNATNNINNNNNNNNKKKTAKGGGSKKNKKLLKGDSQATKENRCITDYFPVVSRRRLAQAKAEDEYRKRILESIDNQTDPTENLIITEFDDKGKGVIASSGICKGSFVCEYAGDLINLDEAKDREDAYEVSGAGCYMYYFEWNKTKWCLDATLPTGRYGRLINHSRKAPNCKTKIFPHNGIPHLIFIALRDINKDEEILYDYGERDPMTMKLNPWLKST